MKLINVIGRSGSGKTTFISMLIGKLNDLGRVATIKHLGHHHYMLEKGKDTTVFFDNGADISAGIDPGKTVLSVRDNDLVSILDLLADQGIDFTVIEGFKTQGLPAIVIGDLESVHELFRNPALEDVMNGLINFPDYYTLASVRAGLRKKAFQAGFMGFEMSVSVPLVPSKSGLHPGFEEMQKIAANITMELSKEYSPAMVAVSPRNYRDFVIPCEIFVAVIANDFTTATRIISSAHDRIMKRTPVTASER